MPTVKSTRAKAASHAGHMALPEKKVVQFVRVRPRRAFEEICDQIRNDVAAGVLTAGDRLPAERDLAEQFGVSRTAVREALRTLEVAGLIQCQTGTNGGAFIKENDSHIVTQAVEDMVRFGQASADEVSEARIRVTCMAIEMACEYATEEDFERIEADIQTSEELTRRGDFTRRSTYITEFYRVLARATHNAVIVMLVDSLSEITRSLMAKVDPVPRSDVITVRRRILQHLRARNSKLAATEMTRHLQSLNQYLKEQQNKRR
ncbi:MAG: GntR family transcriptional regulator [Burkholderiaceae bacterium]|nr:GntR family transcriptional regulator [Desulfobacterales bacterium]MDP3138285.1 GntR family transcriptional regulator [Burkholderiaceae bacterium]